MSLDLMNKIALAIGVDTKAMRVKKVVLTLDVDVGVPVVEVTYIEPRDMADQMREVCRRLSLVEDPLPKDDA